MRKPAAPAESPVRDAHQFIGGEHVDALDGQTFEVSNPATGKVIARVPLGGKQDVADRAVDAAQKRPRGRVREVVGLETRPDAAEVRRTWSRRTTKSWPRPTARTWASRLRSRGESFAVSLVLEYYAGAANKHYGETIPTPIPGFDFHAARAHRCRGHDRAPGNLPGRTWLPEAWPRHDGQRVHPGSPRRGHRCRRYWLSLLEVPVSCRVS